MSYHIPAEYCCAIDVEVLFAFVKGQQYFLAAQFHSRVLSSGSLFKT